MQPPDVTNLLDLPCELLLKILKQIDDESLIQLIMTCKKLHSLAPDVLLLTRFKLPEDIAFFYLQQPPAYLLRALRIALFVHRTSSFVIIPNPDADVFSLNRFIPRVSTMTLSTFIFPGSSGPLSPPDGDTIFDEERWTREVIRLFDMVLDKSCACLEVFGDVIPSRPTLTGTQPTNAPAPRAAFSQRLSCGKICRRIRNLPNTSARTILPLISHRKLQRFHALSPDLFQPQFLTWTTSTLLTSSRTLTTVSFKTDRVPASTWHGLLPKLTLPSLVKFRVTCDRIIEQRTVEFDDVLNFLKRHSSIIDLDLYGLTAPTKRQRPGDLLPDLQMLTSQPELMIWFLKGGDPLRQLHSLNIVSEVYHQPSAFDYNTFNNVLVLLPRSAPLLTSLTMSFFSVDGVTEWLDNHLSRDHGGPLAALEGITRLEVVSPRSWEGEVMDRIPCFLELLPGLQRLVYPALPPNLGMETVKSTFLREIALTCPRMGEVTIGSDEMVDLDSLRKG